MNKRGGLLTALPYLAAFSIGAFAVYVDQHNDEVQAAVLVLLLGTGLLGLAFSRRVWRWALLTGLCIPLFALWASVTHVRASMPEPGWYAGLIALVPAFIGGYCGAAARWALDRLGRTA